MNSIWTECEKRGTKSLHLRLPPTTRKSRAPNKVEDGDAWGRLQFFASDVGARRDQWKICRGHSGGWKLYNVVDDIGEERDLSAKYPERLREMVSEAKRWTRNHVAPRWFDSKKGAEDWKASGMPKYGKTFPVD